ncbi:hypothetical protein RRG08_046419 [Elysia crispata]|uniref:Uncharacterized protein n=1 Tax=Elysia crispata TaxID=231223 RepID=A0AAE0Z8F7_9GAST|nr:hypothetical protein RRG08_046419 [Elysia crispata]
MMDRRLFSDRCVTTAASAREKFPLRNQAARKDTRDLIILEAGSSQTLRMVGGGRRFDGNTGQKKIVCKGGEGGENQQLHRVRFILSGFPRAGALELRLTRGKGRRDFWELWRIGWCRCRAGVLPRKCWWSSGSTSTKRYLVLSRHKAVLEIIVTAETFRITILQSWLASMLQDWLCPSQCPGEVPSFKVIYAYPTMSTSACIRLSCIRPDPRERALAPQPSRPLTTRNAPCV